MLLKDSRGILFSTDFLLTLVLLLIIFGILVNLIDKSNEKISNSIETNNLERLTYKTADNLINSPGSPENWEILSNFDNNIIPGLAIKNNNNETIINTISYKKIKALEKEYSTLIDENIFNNEIKSSIAIYPFNNEITPLTIGDDSSIASNIVVVNRTIKCNFLSDLAILSIDGNEKIDNKYTICNHNTLNILNHSKYDDYIWFCKEFKVKKNDLEYNNYYLLFNEESQPNSYWILDSTNEVSNIENSITNSKVELNNYFQEKLENNNELTFYFHYKVKKEYSGGFNSVIVSIPKNSDFDNLKIDYFKVQPCYFTLKTWY